MLGALLLTVFLLAFTISWALLFPIHRMNESLDVSELANVVKLPEGPYTIDEINELAVNFNRMLERIEDMFDELLIVNRKKNEVEADKKEAELRALQAQINPHFLQNTLNNLIHMIQEGYAAPAISMIQSLSRLFRYGISRGETIIPLREEIEYAKAYAAIMDMRYRGTIRFEWKVDNEALQFKTLKLVLQPLIENAIVHGFRERREGGCIAISCEDAGDYNVLTVSDNGKGITADDLQALRARLYGEDKGGDHIGILNVEQRLRLFFGESCSLTIDSVANKGTTVSLRIPKLTGEEP
jgi:sensor histidine kinase YesM